MINLQTCRSLGHDIQPCGMLFCTTPGMSCAECGQWGSMTRGDFRRAFGIGFDRFVRERLEVSVTTIGSTRIVRGSSTFFASGRVHRPLGNAANRRKLRREIERYRCAVRAEIGGE